MNKLREVLDLATDLIKILVKSRFKDFATKIPRCKKMIPEFPKTTNKGQKKNPSQSVGEGLGGDLPRSMWV